VKSEQFERQYANVFEGDEAWRAIEVPTGDRYAWSEASTYVKNPPYFEGMTMAPPGVRPIAGAPRTRHVRPTRITTDHISPAGNIAAASPPGNG
jgi:aconitate hydratase